MRRALAMPLALSVSLALHGGLAGAILLAAVPKVEPQPHPRADLRIEAYQVERSDAAEARPDTETASEEHAAAAPAAEGAVPQSRADPAALPSERAAEAPRDDKAATPLSPDPRRVAAADPAGARTKAEPPPAERLAPEAPAPSPAAATPPEAPRASPARADAAPAAALLPDAAPVAPARPDSAALPPRAPDAERPLPVSPAPDSALAAVATPDAPAVALSPGSGKAAPVAAEAPRLDAAPPPRAELAASPEPAAPRLPAAAADPLPVAARPAEAAAAPALAPPSAPIPDAAPAAPPAADLPPPRTASPDQSGSAATPLPASPPPAEKRRATLAPIGPDGELDAKSLDAIAAFMQPGDAGAAAAEVRDGIEGLLASVPCARLQVEFDPDTGELTLRGHIPEEGLRDPVLEALTAQIGQGIPVVADLRILPRPQCGALAGIAAIGLPQSEDQSTNPRVMGADSYAREMVYAGGEPLDLALTGADYPSYVYVDYFAADGSVIHLIPSDKAPLTLVAPGKELDTLKARDGVSPVGITFGPPYGQEIAMAFAASRPVYEGLRPMVEPADAYLAELRALIAQARAEDPAFKGEWVYFFISTHE